MFGTTGEHNMTSKRKLGQTGREVFPIGFGAMALSIQGRPDETQAISVIHAALDAGIELIDSADVYCLTDEDWGHNEALLRKALDLREKSPEPIITTKGGLRRPEGEWVVDATPQRLREACEHSLKMLRTDSIFLYQLHASDENVPIEDSIGELTRLQREGKIQHIGVSNFRQDELEVAMKVARIETVQNKCNPNQQTDIKNGLIRFCAENDIAYFAYSPVGGLHGHRVLSQNPVLAELSKKYGASRYCLILAWLLSKGPNVIPIPGASRAASIQDDVKAASLQLSPEDLQKIDKLNPFS